MSDVSTNIVINEIGPNYVLVNQDPPNNVIVQEDIANRVLVDEESPNQVVIRLTGPQYQSTRRFVFSQPSPVSLWEISHGLGGRPSVTVVDSAGTVVIGEVTYISDSQVTVEFTSPFSGYAYLT